MNLSPAGKYRNLIVIVCILILHTAVGIYKIIPLRPQSIHQWAQCDRASVALNYYHESMNFFLPRVHNLDNGTGITGLEFPFVNYSAAILYKVFGYHEWLYRLLTLFIYSCGLFCVFKIADWWLNNFRKSIGVMLLFGCSPLLAFYSANFLPEPSSLGFSLIAWCFLLSYIDTKNKNKLWGWCFFLSLASLIKLSSLINIPAMLLLVWMYEEPADRKKIIPGLLIKVGIIVTLTFSWYRYAMWLSTKTHSEIFLLQSMLPKNWDEFVDVWNQMRKDWFSRIYNDALLIGMFLCLVMGLILPTKTNKKLYYTGGVLLLSGLTFLFSMWTQLRYHDYYMIPMYTIAMFGIIIIVELISRVKWKLITPIFFLVFTGTICFQFYEAKTHLRICYRKGSWKYGSVHFDQFFEFNEVLRNNSVKPEDKIISIFDHTPEISLYLMDQRGVTVAYHNIDRDFSSYLYTREFKYVVYNKASNYDGSIFIPEKYPLEPVYISNNVNIYRVSLDKLPAQEKANYPPAISPWN